MTRFTGCGLCSTALYHPEDAPAPAQTAWSFDHPITGMPESAAPKLGKNSSLVTMKIEAPENANGVLYAFAGFSGGITLYVKDGKEVAQGRVPTAMSLHFTSNATFDIGTDLDSSVSLEYYEQAPFAFEGSIGKTTIAYLKSR